MPKYSVTYKLAVEGTIEITASDEDDAAELVIDYDLSKLLEQTTSEDVEVTGVEEVKTSKG